jgi:hypothetical protein
MYPAQILTRYNVAREDKLGKNTEVDENDKEDGSPEKNQYPPAQTNLADSIRRHLEEVGGVEVQLPPRRPIRKPPDFA